MFFGFGPGEKKTVLTPPATDRLSGSVSTVFRRWQDRVNFSSAPQVRRGGGELLRQRQLDGADLYGQAPRLAQAAAAVIERGCNVNATSKPEHVVRRCLAARFNRRETVRVLLEHGADHAQGSDGGPLRTTPGGGQRRPRGVHRRCARAVFCEQAAAYGPLRGPAPMASPLTRVPPHRRLPPGARRPNAAPAGDASAAAGMAALGLVPALLPRLGARLELGRQGLVTARGGGTRPATRTTSSTR